MSNDSCITCKAITKSYVTEATITPALRGVTLEVKKGELLMLMGPSGCGKTTLISIIAGILNQDSGECSINGTELSKLSDTERTRFRGKHLGFVFQSFNLIPTLTTVENVYIPLLLNGAQKHEAREKAKHVLSYVGLGDKLKVKPKELSGGQQQRVAIARALIHDPALIVCDEPTSALDQDTGQKVMEIFRNVASNDKRTIIIVTHDSRILSYADRIAKMNDGKIEDITSQNGSR